MSESVVFWRAWFDGAAAPNPGRIGLGGLLLDPAGKAVAEISEAPGHGTNNEAEYLALIAVLEAALANGVEHLLVHGDSQLVINQVEGTWAVNAPGIKAHHRKAVGLVKQFKQVRFEWIRREKNKAADALSKQALGHSAEPEGAEHVWQKQTQIGKVLGLSAIALGRLTDAAGLRENGKPTQDALDNGAARIKTNHFGDVVSWHCDRLPQLLRERGLLAALDKQKEEINA